jgi:hypothetical protein
MRLLGSIDGVSSHTLELSLIYAEPISSPALLWDRPARHR